MPALGTEKKLVFTDEEARMKAAEELSDVIPEGKDPNEFANEYDDQLEAIYAAEINPEYKPEITPDDPAAATNPNPDEGALAVEADRLRAIEDEKDRIAAENARLSKEIADEKAEREKIAADLKKIKEDAAAREKKEKDEGKDSLASKISEVQKEIARIRAEKSSLTDPYSEDSMKKTDELLKLSDALSDLRDKKHDQAFKEMQEKASKEEKERQDENERNKKAKEAKAIEEADTKAKSARNTAIDNFRDRTPELKGTVPYAQMSADYDKFAAQVSEIFYGRPLTADEAGNAEIAIQKYLEGTPDLVAKVKQKNLKEPADMRKFLVMSEIDLLMQGWSFNKTTGRWDAIKNEITGEKVTLANHDQAFSEYQRRNGKPIQDILKASQASADSLLGAIEQRPRAIELTGSQEAGTIDEMTQEEAVKIFTSADENLMAKLIKDSPTDPRLIQFERAGKAAGFFESLEEMFPQG